MQGDICPGDLAPISKLFLVLFALSGLGFFCGPLLEVSSSSWTKHVPGGLATLATLTVGIGVAIFSNIEGVSQSEAFYASIIAGTYDMCCKRRWHVCIDAFLFTTDGYIVACFPQRTKGRLSGK